MTAMTYTAMQRLRMEIYPLRHGGECPSQDGIAPAAGYTTNGYIFVERGINMPRVSKIGRLARTLGVAVEDVREAARLSRQRHDLRKQLKKGAAPEDAAAIAQQLQEVDAASDALIARLRQEPSAVS